MKIAIVAKTTIFLEIRDFNFNDKSVFKKWCNRSNYGLSVEGIYKYNIDDIAYEIIRCEDGIDSAEFVYNAKNKRYLGVCYTKS